MAWTNSALKTLFDEHGTEVRSIRSTAFVVSLYITGTGQPMLTKDDITFETIGGTDVFKVRRYNPNNKKYFYEYCTTEFIEKIIMVGDENDTIDPYMLAF